MAPGTEIVFEYPVREVLLDAENRRLLAVLKAGAATRWEPWLSFFAVPPEPSQAFVFLVHSDAFWRRREGEQR